MNLQKTKNEQWQSRFGGTIILLVGAALSLTSPAWATELSAKETWVAQKLYSVKCAKCHKFYNPKAYSQAEWDSWMQKMRTKSKLKADQFALLSQYIDTNLRAAGDAPAADPKKGRGQHPSH